MSWKRKTIVSILFLVITIKEWCYAETYRSFDHSQPAFQYIRNNFTCVQQHKRILWDMLTFVVHPHNDTRDCGAVILEHEHAEIWRPLKNCINDNNTADAQCRQTAEHGIIFQFNITALLQNNDIQYLCVSENKEPEITAIDIIYFCEGDRNMPIEDHDDIIAPAGHRTPPIPPYGGETTHLMPPPRPSPTMVTHPIDEATVTVRHNIVTTQKPATSKTTASSPKGVPEKKPEDKESENSDHQEASREHAVTARELAVIIGPSIGALILVIVVGIVIFVLYKRKQLKFPGDLQGESLFNSRRFSTASQISDISVNTQPFRVTP